MRAFPSADCQEGDGELPLAHIEADMCQGRVDCHGTQGAIDHPSDPNVEGQHAQSKCPCDPGQNAPQPSAVSRSWGGVCICWGHGARRPAVVSPKIGVAKSPSYF